MTKENALRLYNHYLDIDYKEAAADMLAKHPEFASHHPDNLKDNTKTGVKKDAKKT